MTRIAAGSGVGRGKPADQAALDAALSAMTASGVERADLALVFTTGDAYPQAHALLHAVRRITGARTVLGCSGAGVLTEEGEVEGEPAVAVLVLRADPASPVEPFLVADQERLDAGAAVELAERLGPTLGEGGALMILPDPTNLDPCGLLAGVAETFGPLPVLGGVAAGGPLFELYNTDAARGTLPGLAFPRVRPVVGVAQGCQPVGEPYVITRAEGNVIRAIAGHPAVEVLREAIHSLSGFEGRLRHAGIFAGLAINPAKSPLERGDFLVRNLVGVEPETGAVAVADHVRVGQTIQFQIRDGEAARDDLEAMLARAAVDLGGREPAFGVYFNCTGRGRGLYGAPDHDVTRIRGGLGKWPLIGFFGNGEFAPVGGTNFFHNYTGVLVLFPQP